MLATADLAVLGASLFLAYKIRADLLVRFPLWEGHPRLFPTYFVLFIGTAPIILFSLYMCRAFSVKTLRSRWGILGSVFKAVPGAALATLAFAFVLRDHTFSRAIVAAYLAIAMPGLLLDRLWAREALQLLRARGVGVHKTVVVGTGDAPVSIAAHLAARPDLGYEVVGLVSAGERSENARSAASSLPFPILGTVEDLPALVDEAVIDSVLFAISLDHAARYERIIWALEEVGTTVHLRGDAVGVLLSRTFIGEFEGMPILTLRSAPAAPIPMAIKRCLDVVGASLGILVTFPLLIATAMAIKASSPGPVFFRQQRVGRNGRLFDMIKFRSMHTDAESRLEQVRAGNEMSGPVFKMSDDPRITRVGKWIRKFSVDELPQFWNVLRGEMSLVGPRPPLPDEVRKYERWQRRRLSMKPGLTCLWQVSGRNDIDFDTWMKLDMEYIDNWSLVLDIKILLRTIPVVLTAKGAK